MLKSILVSLFFSIFCLAVGQEIPTGKRNHFPSEKASGLAEVKTASSPRAFTSSNLPIILIDTHGKTIPDEPKIPAGLKIIDNRPGKRNNITDTPVYNGFSGFEIRGSGAQMFPKKNITAL